MSSPVRVRFAPSPTGYLHVGGARTALFNWLYACAHGGTFVLRIEDTDEARNTAAAQAAIVDGLRWLGIDWDEGPEKDGPHAPYYQSQRAAIYDAYFQKLVEAGHTYTEENGAVRFRSPKEILILPDKICGDIKIDRTAEPDMTIRRPDGSYIFHFVNVVDDIEMEITHVIRGEDHIFNTGKHIELFRAFGAEPPVYAHIPLIHGADGAKLSKRHGALGVDAYRDDMGLLPEAVFNYLLRLGWGHGDEEIISRDQAVDWFDIADVNKGASRFDQKKLLNLNGHYIREADDARLAGLVANRLAALAPAFTAETGMDLLTRAMPELKVRAADLNELAQGAVFLFVQRPLPMTEKASALLTDDAKALLTQVAGVLDAENGWTTESLEATVKQMAEELGIGLGKIAQPLRASLTGQTTSPGIFDVLALLGKDESLARIRDHAA